MEIREYSVFKDDEITRLYSSVGPCLYLVRMNKMNCSVSSVLSETAQQSFSFKTF